MSSVKVLKDALWTFYKSLKRFPLPSVLSVVLAILTMIFIHNEGIFEQELAEIFNRLILVVGLSIALFLLIAILFEKLSEKVNVGQKIVVNIMALGLLTLYYFFLIQEINFVSLIRFFITLTSVFIFFLIIPYILNRKNLELYIMRLFIRAVISAFYAAVIFAGVSAILFTTDKLLGIKIEENVYLDIWISALSVFGMLYFMAGIPNRDEEFSLKDYNIVLKILFLYIVMPLTAIYTAILYIYFIKIIISFDWPNGIVSFDIMVWDGCYIINLPDKTFVNENKWQSFIVLDLKAIVNFTGIMFFHWY